MANKTISEIIKNNFGDVWVRRVWEYGAKRALGHSKRKYQAELITPASKRRLEMALSGVRRVETVYRISANPIEELQVTTDVIKTTGNELYQRATSKNPTTLSTHAYHLLRRAGCLNADRKIDKEKLANMLVCGKFFGIRGAGKKTLKELCDWVASQNGNHPITQ